MQKTHIQVFRCSGGERSPPSTVCNPNPCTPKQVHELGQLYQLGPCNLQGLKPHCIFMICRNGWLMSKKQQSHDSCFDECRFSPASSVRSSATKSVQYLVRSSARGLNKGNAFWENDWATLEWTTWTVV